MIGCDNLSYVVGLIQDNKYFQLFNEKCFNNQIASAYPNSSSSSKKSSTSDYSFADLEQLIDSCSIDFQKIFGYKISSTESLHAFSIMDLGSFRNEETYWLIEGRIALGRILYQLLKEQNDIVYVDLLNVAIGELHDQLETHSQFLLCAYLLIIQGLVNHCFGRKELTSQLKIKAGELLDWLLLFDQSKLTQGFTKEFQIGLSYLEQEQLSLADIDPIIENLFQFNWMMLFITNPYFIPPPKHPYESISISKESLTLFGFNAGGKRNLSTLLGTFVVALSELVKEIYDDDEWLEDVWFETGRILNFHHDEFSFTLLSKEINKTQDLRLICFALNVLRHFEFHQGSIIEEHLDRDLMAYSYRYFGLGDPLPVSPEFSQLSGKKVRAKGQHPSFPDIVFILEKGTPEWIRIASLQQLPYLSNRFLLVEHPDNIDPFHYLTFNLIVPSKRTPDIDKFIETILFLNPSIRIKSLDEFRQDYPKFDLNFILNVLWDANMAKRVKIHSLLVNDRSQPVALASRKWFETNYQEYTQNLQKFFMEIMNIDISILLKKKIVRELPSLINYYFNIVRMWFKSLGTVQQETREYS
ncbi:MAG: hypothetical protein D6732_14260, partial [Methanobacteriota archaeon]